MSCFSITTLIGIVLFFGRSLWARALNSNVTSQESICGVMWAFAVYEWMSMSSYILYGIIKAIRKEQIIIKVMMVSYISVESLGVIIFLQCGVGLASFPLAIGCCHFCIAFSELVLIYYNDMEQLAEEISFL